MNKTEENNKSGNENDTVTELSDYDSFIQQKAWDEISIAGEYHNCIQATADERRKVFNTLDKLNIELAEAEQWKNREWTKLESIVQEYRQKEYSIMKRIVGAISSERESKIGNNNKEKEKVISKLNNEKHNGKHANNQWTSHPPSSESLPQKNNESKGQGA